MPAEEVKKIYDILSASGNFNMPGINEFATGMMEEPKRRKVYDMFSQTGKFNMPSYEEFTSRMTTSEPLAKTAAGTPLPGPRPGYVAPSPAKINESNSLLVRFSEGALDVIGGMTHETGELLKTIGFFSPDRMVAGSAPKTLKDGIMHNIQNSDLTAATDAIGDHFGIPREERQSIFTALGNYLSGAGEELTKFGIKESSKLIGIPIKPVLQGVGGGIADAAFMGAMGIPGSIAKVIGIPLMAGRGGMALFSTMDAIKKSTEVGNDLETVIQDAAKGLVKGGLSEIALHGLSKLPMSGRVLGGAAFGAIPGVSSRDPEEIASGAVTMALLSLPGGRRSWKEAIDSFKEDPNISHEPLADHEKTAATVVIDAIKKSRPDIAEHLEGLNNKDAAAVARGLVQAVGLWTPELEAKMSGVLHLFRAFGLPEPIFISPEEMGIRRKEGDVDMVHLGSINKKTGQASIIYDPILAAHEIGHELINGYIRTDVGSLPIEELRAIRKNIDEYMTDRYAKTLGTRINRPVFDTTHGRKEGTADFISLYLNDKKAAMEIAPKLSATVGTEVDKIISDIGRPAETADQWINRHAAEIAKPAITGEQLELPIGQTEANFGRPAITPRVYGTAEYVSGEPSLERLRAKLESQTEMELTQQMTLPLKSKEVVEYFSNSNVEFVGVQKGFGDIEDMYLFNHPDTNGSTLAVTKSEFTPEGIERRVAEWKKDNGLEDTTEPASTEYATGSSKMRQRIFGSAKNANIDRSTILRTLKKMVGSENVQFHDKTLPNYVSEELGQQLVDRIRYTKQKSYMTPEEKTYYIENGVERNPVVNEDMNSAIEDGNPVMKSARSFIDGWFVSIGERLRKLGPVGTVIADRNDRVQAFAHQGEMQSRVVIDRALKNLSGDDVKALVSAVDSGSQEAIDLLPPNIRAAVEPIMSAMKEIDSYLKMLKVRTTRIDPNTGKVTTGEYEGMSGPSWRHMWDYDPKHQVKRQKAFVEAKIREGMTKEAATKQLDDLIRSRSGNLFGPISYGRTFDVGGWLGDPNSPTFSKREAIKGLYKYLNGAWKFIAETRYWDKNGANLLKADGTPVDPNFKSIQELLASEPDIAKRNVMTQAYNTMRGLDAAEPERPLFAALRNLASINMLGLFAIPNFFQPLVTLPTVTGKFGLQRQITIMAKGLYQFAKHPEFARDEVGVGAIQNMTDILINAHGPLGKLTARIIGAYSLSTEVVNKLVAASVGKPYVQEVMRVANGSSPSRILGIPVGRPSAKLRKTAITELKRLGVSQESIDAGKLSDFEITAAAHKLATITQMGGGVADFPMMWNKSEYGKMATQFKKYSFGMSRIVYHDVVKPLIQNGNAVPLLSLLGSSLVAGEAVNFIKQTLLQGKDRSDSELKRVVEDVVAVGSLGIFLDVVNTAQFGRGFLQYAAGPVPSHISQTAQYLANGDLRNAIAKQIPILKSTAVLKESESSKRLRELQKRWRRFE